MGLSILSHVQTFWASDIPIVQETARLLVTWRDGADGRPAPAMTVYNSVLWSAATLSLSDGLVAPADISSQSFNSRRGTTSLTIEDASRLINTLPLSGMSDPGGVGPVSGMQDSTTVWLDRSAFSGNALTMHRFDDFLYVSERMGGGLTVFDMSTVPPSRLFVLEDRTDLRLESISSMTSLKTEAGSFLIVASQDTDSISVLRIGAGGQLTPLSSIGTEAFLPVDMPSKIGTVSLNGQHFVLLGSFGSDSLTVLRLSEDGRLSYVDQVIDSRSTRFDGLSAMDILVIQGQVLVAVAGHDGGVTLFQLLPSGRLVLLDSLEDSVGMALQNIVDLRFVVVGDRIELFALASGDGGVTRLLLDPARFGPGLGGIVGTTIQGTDGNDVLTAPRGAVLVQGGAGDDILVANTGATTLDGGAGSDIFVLQADPGQRDTILNFDPAHDRIDLSAFPMVYGTDGLNLQSTASGALLRIGTTEISIVAGRSLSISDLRTALLFNTDRLLTPINPPESSTIPPVTTDDTFYWAQGPRLYDGGGGTDRVSYVAAPSGAIIDLQQSSRNAGSATGHQFAGIEIFLGSAFNDQISGDALSNTLVGNAGNDSLDGRDGDDVISPGAGNDTVDGGAGSDTVSFADAAAGVVANLAAGMAQSGGEVDVLRNVENVIGSGFDDSLTGNHLANLLEGLLGNDWITPGAGNDTVDGGEGVDMVSFFDAPERVVVDLLAGTAVIGAETDRLYNIENVTGSIYADLITGDAGANRIRALGDYDWMVGSGGGDTFEGGTGRDTVAYSNATSGVWASLLSDTGSVGQANGDRYVDVENLTGSSHGDRLTGDNDRNMLRGLGGDDFLFGNGGNDTLIGGSGRDYIDGGAQNDRMMGERGNDTIDGGYGWDTAIYSGRQADYTVTRNADGSTTVLHNGGGIDGIDLVLNVEVLQFSDGRMFL